LIALAGCGKLEAVHLLFALIADSQKLSERKLLSADSRNVKVQERVSIGQSTGAVWFATLFNLKEQNIMVRPILNRLIEIPQNI
jgi:hypothetical protein